MWYAPLSNEKVIVEPVSDVPCAFYPIETQPCKAGLAVVKLKLCRLYDHTTIICTEEQRNSFLQDSLEILPTEKRSLQTLRNVCFCFRRILEQFSGVEFLSHLLEMLTVLLGTSWGKKLKNYFDALILAA